MVIDTLVHVIETYGLWVVFFCVLLNQGGIPVPAYPPMIVTAALAVDAGNSLWQRRRLLDSGVRIRILDVRDPARRDRSGWIPNSLGAGQIDEPSLDQHDEVVIYCDCPNDASAAVAAHHGRCDDCERRHGGRRSRHHPPSRNPRFVVTWEFPDHCPSFDSSHAAAWAGERLSRSRSTS